MQDLPFKSLLELKKIISYYQSLAQTKVQNQRNDLKMDVSPIDQWIKVLQTVKGRRITLDHVSRAFKYIALYEKRAKSDVDLKNCYMVLSALTKGIPAKELDPPSLSFFQANARELAQRLSSENVESERKFLENWSTDNIKMCRSYGRKDSAISNVVNNPDINPLSVPQNLLTIRDNQ